MANITFHIAGGPGSGVEIPSLSGTAVFKYVGLFGPSGAGDFITTGEAQDLTWLSNASGNIDGTLAGSGKMTNNKWTDASGVSIDGGARQALSGVNQSGDATIMIQVSGASGFYVHNPRLYAYDATFVGNDPSGVHVLSYEIIPQGTSGIGDNEWALIDATNYNQFVDRAQSIGYESGSPNTIHQFHVGLSVRPKATATSGHQVIGLWFDCDVTHVPA